MMRAIGYPQPGPVDADDALVVFDTATPSLRPYDVLVRVKGVSMNPVDVKVRAGSSTDQPRVLGFDASGVVEACGEDVTRFAVGDEVYYSGQIDRPGSNAELQAVDERLVGRKPSSLGFADAAGMALTSITAWEILFDSFNLKEGSGEGETLLIVGGAGGVGSILTQLAKTLTKLTVVTTASRPETVTWSTRMGADHVVNHRASLVDQLAELDLAPKYVASLTHSDQHIEAIVSLIAPRGHIALIDDPKTLDVVPLKLKALTVSWELMFTRSLFQMDDMDVQHHLLNRVADLLDEGKLQSTVTQNLGDMSVETLLEAHRFQESGKAIGKTVLNGFSSPS